MNIKYSYDGEKPLGPIGALKNAEPLLENDFLIMYGDSYISIDFQEIYTYYMLHDKPAMMVVYRNEDKYDKSNLIVENNMVVGYDDKTRLKDMVYIDYGTSVQSKKSIEKLEENMFYSTKDFFTNLINQNQLLAFESKKRFYHIGTPEALDEFRQYIKNR